MLHERPILTYSKRPDDHPWRTRRVVVWLSVALATLLICYVGVWLSIADGGLDWDGYGPGFIDYSRIPGHAWRAGVISTIFTPAYGVDRWLRPRYWNWTERPEN
jgi:hypothetical protein